MAKKISVVMLAQILNEEHVELTNKTIESLKRTIGWEDCEFIIIDNGSDNSLVNRQT